MGHELLSRDELAVLDGGKCILQLRGVRPFLSDKYDLTQHPNYKLTSDYDPKNTFDIEKYLNRKTKMFIVGISSTLPSTSTLRRTLKGMMQLSAKNGRQTFLFENGVKSKVGGV